MTAETGWQDRTLLPWQPHSKVRPRISKGGARTHQDPRDKAAETRTRDFLRGEVERRGLPLLTGNVTVQVQFYRATRQVVDLDNLLKHLLDCGNGIIWKDDCQITCYRSIRLDLDREYPRTELWVYPDKTTTMKRGSSFA